MPVKIHMRTYVYDTNEIVVAYIIIPYSLPRHFNFLRPPALERIKVYLGSNLAVYQIPVT